MISAQATHPGLVRQNNEDSIRTDDVLGIYLLADGIGGHNAGEVASAIAVDTVYSVLRSNITRTAVDEYFELMIHAMHVAHWEISSRAQTSSMLARMGTTLTVAVVRDGKAYVVNAGDSRCYLFRREPAPGTGHPPGNLKKTLQRLTHDHTLGDRMLSAGISIGQIPKRDFHSLTQSVGCGDPPYPDFTVAEISQGDLLLICSDGLTDMLPDAEIEALLARADVSLDMLADELINAANASGGRDNISVILASAQ